MKKVCYVLAYACPDYIRTKTLLQSLRQIDHLTVLTAVNRRRSVLRYVETIWQAFRIRMKDNPDIWILGFRGHEIFWMIRLISWGKPLIFDSMMSPYASLYEEGKFGKIGRFFSRMLFPIEQSILNGSDVILTDTPLHVEFLAKCFRISQNKFYWVPVGADEQHEPSYGVSSGSLEVLFFGTFLPLHGIPIILEAAANLKNKPVHFTLIGGQGKPFNMPDNITHIPWVKFDQLISSYIPQSDLCLGGPFGGTPQAKRVISGKTFQCLAMGKATVVGRIEEDMGFVDRCNCLLVEQGNSDALINAIEWAYQHRQQLEEIGKNGRRLYEQRFSIACIRKRLQQLLDIHEESI